MCKCFLFIVMCLFKFSAIHGQTIKIAVLLPESNRFLFSIRRVAPAVSLAIEVVTKEILPGANVSVRYSDSKCSSADAMNEAINFYVDDDVDVFLGPVCDYAVAPVARQINFWDIPMITTGAMAEDFTLQKEENYPLLTKTGLDLASAADFLEKFIRSVDFKNVKLLYEPEGQSSVVDRFCHFAASTVVQRLKQENNLRVKYLKMDGGNTSDLENFLDSESAVVLMCADPDPVRDVMIKARQLNLTTNGHIFLNMDFFASKSALERLWYRENSTDEENIAAKEAYKAMLTMALKKPDSPDYRAFENEVKRRAKEIYNPSPYEKEEVNSFVSGFYDAVLLYAMALKEMPEGNASIVSGTAITKLMWNRAFQGISGTVSIDGIGNRKNEFDLLEQNPETGVAEPVKEEEVVKTRFKVQEVAVVNTTIPYCREREEPPTEEPECGKDGKDCAFYERFPSYATGILLVGLILLVATVTAVILYKWVLKKRTPETPTTAAA